MIRKILLVSLLNLIIDGQMAVNFTILDQVSSNLIFLKFRFSIPVIYHLYRPFGLVIFLHVDHLSNAEDALPYELMIINFG